MFQWDKSISSIDVPAHKVVHLFRSIRELQLALPGVAAQEASAYLCQYQGEDGVGTVAVFHLHKSKTLAFYSSNPRLVPKQKIDSMLDQGLNFVESMGFLMTDQDIHLLDEADQEMLWSSLPLKSGLAEEAEQEKAGTSSKAPEIQSFEHDVQLDTAPQGDSLAKSPASVVEKSGSREAAPLVETEQAGPEGDEAASGEAVDDLLAAVEAMRAKRPGLRARKSPPQAEEIARRKLQLRETVGRILGSL